MYGALEVAKRFGSPLGRGGKVGDKILALVLGPNGLGWATYEQHNSHSFDWDDIQHGSGNSWSVSMKVVIEADNSDRLYLAIIPNTDVAVEWLQWVESFRCSLQEMGKSLHQLDSFQVEHASGQPDFGLLPEERLASQIAIQYGYET